jgi:uncharacterized protein with PQ loop repeat
MLGLFTHFLGIVASVGAGFVTIRFLIRAVKERNGFDVFGCIITSLGCAVWLSYSIREILDLLE